jgi:hypothetical protein
LALAGFSAPIGYPVGNKLNQVIGNCGGDVFAFHSDGTLSFNPDGSKIQSCFKTSYDIQFDFLIDVINFYREERNGFDYEEFYDFLIDEIEDNTITESLANKYLGHRFSTYRNLISGLSKIYSQIISYFLVDGSGKRWYDDEPYHCDFRFPGYTGILHNLHNLSKKGSVAPIAYSSRIERDLFEYFSEWLNRCDRTIKLDKNQCFDSF